MLTASRATTILPVTDPDRASRFYAEQLGLRPTGTAGDGTRMFEMGLGRVSKALTSGVSMPETWRGLR